MEIGGAFGKIIRRAMDDKGDKMERPKRKTTQRQTTQEMGGRHYQNGWTKLEAAYGRVIKRVFEKDYEAVRSSEWSPREAAPLIRAAHSS
ncbi:hypothetical protein EVAR_85429_1 [Eumeta japonica]|uniref:Uncharacterized protein n=1 Tax=Eumeta variegata TaxID=151549 RepID=A0A4C1WII1_EUMVA|nr:hypothetical protein EVAR_85429_1 [Eumeta japonica]